MNKEYVFLENLSRLLKQGYGIEETLLICKEITHFNVIDDILVSLYNGEDLRSSLINSDLPKDFLDYFEFFSEKFVISDAITNALNICKRLKETKKKLISQLTYPAVLVVFIFFFSIFVTLVLVPKVYSLYQSFSIKFSLPLTVLFMFMRLLPVLFTGAMLTIVIIIIHFIRALNHRNYKVIDHYLKIPVFKDFIRKYFTLRLSIYFNELLIDHLDANTIIGILNEKVKGDLKILLYEIEEKIREGISFEQAIESFDYIDPLFTSMYKMYLKSPDEIQSIQSYIDISYGQINRFIERFIKIFVPCVYSFVAFFVIAIYVGIILPMMNIVSGL